MEVVDVQEVFAGLPDVGLFQRRPVGGERAGVEPDPERQQEAGAEEPEALAGAQGSRSRVT
jgi:hypothetical protein